MLCGHRQRNAEFPTATQAPRGSRRLPPATCLIPKDRPFPVSMLTFTSVLFAPCSASGVAEVLHFKNLICQKLKTLPGLSGPATSTVFGPCKTCTGPNSGLLLPHTHVQAGYQLLVPVLARSRLLGRNHPENLQARVASSWVGNLDMSTLHLLSIPFVCLVDLTLRRRPSVKRENLTFLQAIGQQSLLDLQA